MAAKEQKQQGVNFKDLGIGQILESDRMPVDEHGPMGFTKYMVDTRTKYYDKINHTGGILKFDAIDDSTGNILKYFTTSKVLIEQFEKIAEIVGYKEVADEKKQVWNVFKTIVNIDGIEMVSSGTPGYKPYPKIIIKE